MHTRMVGAIAQFLGIVVGSIIGLNVIFFFYEGVPMIVEWVKNFRKKQS